MDVKKVTQLEGEMKNKKKLFTKNQLGRFLDEICTEKDEELIDDSRYEFSEEFHKACDEFLGSKRILGKGFDEIIRTFTFPLSPEYNQDFSDRIDELQERARIKLEPISSNGKIKNMKKLKRVCQNSDCASAKWKEHFDNTVGVGCISFLGCAFKYVRTIFNDDGGEYIIDEIPFEPLLIEELIEAFKVFPSSSLLFIVFTHRFFSSSIIFQFLCNIT